MRSSLTFLAGLAVGLSVHVGLAQGSRLSGVNGVNHVAFVTPNYEAMKTFYTEVMGFPEAFTIRNASGQPTLTYLQANRNTFVELMPAGANRPAAFSHFGLHVEDVRAVTKALQSRGVMVAEPRTIGSGAFATNVTDPDGNRIEVSELGSEAPARKAMDAWK